MTFCNIDTPKGRNLTKVLRDILADEGDVDRLARAIVDAADNGGSVDALIAHSNRPRFRSMLEEQLVDTIVKVNEANMMSTEMATSIRFCIKLMEGRNGCNRLLMQQIFPFKLHYTCAEFSSF